MLVDCLLKIFRTKHVKNSSSKILERHVKGRVADEGALLRPHALIQALHHGANPVRRRQAAHVALRGHDPLLEHLVGILVGGLLLWRFECFGRLQNLSDAVFEFAYNLNPLVERLRIALRSMVGLVSGRSGNKVRHGRLIGVSRCIKRSWSFEAIKDRITDRASREIVKTERDKRKDDKNNSWNYFGRGHCNSIYFDLVQSAGPFQASITTHMAAV